MSARERDEEEAVALEAAARALLPGLRRSGPLRRSLKSRLLTAELDGEPVLIKQLASDDPIWRWYFERELELYRAFAREPPPVRIPRVHASDLARSILVLERLAADPIAVTRRADAIDGRVCDSLARICARLGAWSRGLELAPRDAPPPRDLREMRRRLLEDPSAPLAWVQEGIARCAALDLLASDDAQAAHRALDAHPELVFAHGDLMPRNAIPLPDGEVALIDWECAGAHPWGWDRALLWANAPAARPLLEPKQEPPGRARAFWACVVYALTREIKFRARSGRADRRVELLRAELAVALRRMRS